MSRRVTSSLVVVGSGPSTGRAVAGLFAQKRYDNIALISRGRDRLEQDKAFVESMADRRVNVKTYAIDITDEQALCSTVQRIETELGRPETIFFNAARVQGSKLLETSADEVEYDLKINAIALYNTARLTLPGLVDLHKSDSSACPSLIVANSFLATSPLAGLFSLSMAKAAQRNLVESLAQTFSSSGVHIGFVTIGGVISPDKNKMSPKNIAEDIWAFFASDEKRNDVELYIADE